MKNYKQFNIMITPFNVDLVSGLLWELDIEGLLDEDNKIIVYAHEDKNLHVRDFIKILDSLKNENIIETYFVTESSLKNKNWNEEWEKRVNVIPVTDKIVIKPSFKEYTPSPGQIIITIDPKMSFGTGEHQTTKLVIRLLDKYVKPGIKVLDVGSGTGILAITSVKLGAAEATAVDNDEWCLLNGEENIKLNNLTDKIKMVLGETSDVAEKEFDLIAANINKHILLQIAQDLKNKIKKTGNLIVSGLLTSDESDIISCYNNLGFTTKEKLIMDEWLAIVFSLD